MTEQVRPSLIVKVGGSLLDWPELSERLPGFLQGLGDPAKRTLLLAGGGATVDLIRALDPIHHFGEERSHHLAIQALDLTALILSNILGNSRVIFDESEFAACWDAGTYPILAPSRLLGGDLNLEGDALPESWEVTSDSIAAWLAARLRVERLVLLKSANVPHETSRSLAARLGLVDPYFPRIASGLKWVESRNLRDPDGSLIALSRSE